MIEIKNLYVAFTKEFNALHNINLIVNNGENVALIGENESGKTTLLRIIAGLEQYKQGEVYIKGINLNKIDYKSDVSLAYVPQTPVLMKNKTVAENLRYVLKIRNYDNATINYKVLSALNNFSLENLKDVKVCKLSTYQKMLIQLARVSMRNVDLFLIDDIFINLTPAESEQLLVYLKNLVDSNENSTFVFASSNEMFAKALQFSVIKMEKGSFVKN